jgi:thymidylate synthase
MKIINARNVNDALLRGIDLFNDSTQYRVQESRNGNTYEALEPVTTVYKRPWERVCLVKQRDANPFFHYIEGLWMLAGRKDLKPLTYFVKSMKDFSDDEETLWGAYGWRWRDYFHKDQLDIIVKMLKTNPDDRRCVLQMWDANKDLNRQGKDVPCNTNIYFKIRDNELHMTVCNRSNDMLWGAYGANVVHMSMLQEYMASRIGVSMGTYRQVSDSFHVYLNPVWDKVKDIELDIYTQREIKNPYDTLCVHTNYEQSDHVALVTDPLSFDWELKRFFGIHPMDFEAVVEGWENAAFREIGVPMMKAYAAYTIGELDYACEKAEEIKAIDWRRTCLEWIRKREMSLINKADEGETYE